MFKEPSSYQKKSIKLLKFLGIVTGLLFIIFVILYFSPLRWNFSGSMPIGIYHRVQQTSIKPGDWVAACLPSDIAKEGRQHHYLMRGQCAENSKPILKEVIGVPGDRILVSDVGLFVNQQFYFAPQLKHDFLHLPIRRWTQNKRYFLQHSVWLYGCYDPIHSWDSRYFGSIPIKNILGIYRPLLIYPAHLPAHSVCAENCAVARSPELSEKPNSHLAWVYFPPYFVQSTKFPDPTHTTSEWGQEPDKK